MARIVWALGWPALALGVVFAPALANLAEVWSSRDYYTHGYLVPLVSLWAAAGIVPRRRKLAIEPDARGLLGIGLAGGLYAAGLGVSWVPLQGVALVAAVASLVWLRCGTAWLSALTFPIGYLGFMVPLPDAWITPVIVKLQLFVSEVGVGLLRSVGFAIYRDGNVLELPGGESLFVAEACSGITSVITLLPIAMVLAYFTDRALRRRVLLVASVIPVALAGNLIRVFTTVFAAERWGAEVATAGSLHESVGVVTYALGCAVLLGIGTLLRRWIPDGGLARPLAPR
jgi:exosortase